MLLPRLRERHSFGDAALSDRRIDRYFSGGDLVPDLGCGSGTWIESISSRNARAVGLGISDSARRRGGVVVGWDFIEQDLNAGAVPLPDGCADGVLANQALEPVANPLRLVNEADRILRPGGVLVVTTPNVRYLPHGMRLVVRGTGPMTSGEALRTSEAWDDGHVHFLTARDLEWLARTAGFARFHTEALVSTTGGARSLRRALDRYRTRALLKELFSGNVMLVAWK